MVDLFLYYYCKIKNMKNILCYGDSNTYGYDPKTGERYDENTRWTALLQKFLINEWNVIEEGCNNRTAIFDNECGVEQTGARYLPTCLAKYTDIDTILISLGANDLQKFFDHSDENIKKGMSDLIKIVREYDRRMRIIIVAPPKLSLAVLTGNFSNQFDEHSIRQSLKMKQLYTQISLEEFCETLSLDDVVKVSEVDGLHFDIDAHKKIAVYFTEYLMR